MAQIREEQSLSEYKAENAHLFYGDVYVGDNIRHLWLPFDYGENYDSCADYHEWHYVRLSEEVDPAQTIFGYCLFHIDEGILELGHMRANYDAYNGDYDTDYSPVLELTLEGILGDLASHLRLQLQHYREKGVL